MSAPSEKEIEIKLSFRNKDGVLGKLGSAARFLKIMDMHDIYYGFDDTEMKNTRDILRLRITDKESELTYKSKAEDSNNVWHRTELTTSVGAPEMMDKILTSLGIKKLYEYASRKEYYSYGNCEIVFADFELPAQLEFMEIEGPSEEEIKAIVSELGDSVREVGEEFFKVFDDARKKKD